jgi:hypothetical protein
MDEGIIAKIRKNLQKKERDKVSGNKGTVGTSSRKCDF